MKRGLTKILRLVTYKVINKTYNNKAIPTFFVVFTQTDKGGRQTHVDLLSLSFSQQRQLLRENIQMIQVHLTPCSWNKMEYY